MSLVTDLIAITDIAVDHYVFDGYHAMVRIFSMPLATLLMIYFAGLGWCIIRGILPLTPLAISWHLLKAVFIFTFALHWDYFSYFVVHFFMHGADKIVAVMLADSGGSDYKISIINALSHVWEKGINVFINVLRMSGSDFILGTLMGFLGCCMIIGIVAVALFYIMMSKVVLSILLILAPIILPMFLWEHTRGIFNSWLQLLIQWMITPVMVYAFIGFFLKLAQHQIDEMAQLSDGPTTAAILGFTLVGVIIIAALKQAGHISRHLSKKINVSHWQTPDYTTIPSIAYKAWQSR